LRNVPQFNAEKMEAGTKTPSKAGIRVTKKILQVFRNR
jgi:hypothetical protein